LTAVPTEPSSESRFERGLPWAAGLVLLLALLAEFRSLIRPDTGFLLDAAGRVLDGAVIYRDVVEINPPLIVWLDRGRFAPRPGPKSRGLMTFVARAVAGRPRVFAVGALVVTLLAVWQVRSFGRAQLEYDFSRLRRADTWTSGEGYWGRKMEAVLRRNLSPTVILTAAHCDWGLPRMAVTFDSDYTEFLPSMNLAFNVTDSIVTRLSASKTLTRANPNALRPATTFNDPSAQNASTPGFSVVTSDLKETSLTRP
jgi:hypothetical protein